ncbi:hypothetical protein K435DRAFT_707156, partial [Dendrothele bispora CBS 962.96]
MPTLLQAVDEIKKASGNASQISLSQLVSFFLICTRIKNNILLLYPSSLVIHHPIDTPPILPHESITFLGRTCQLEMNDVEACWNAVKDDVWHGDEMLRGVQNDEALQQTFRKHGGGLYR